MALAGSRLAVHWATIAVIVAVALGALAVGSAPAERDPASTRGPGRARTCANGPVALTFDDGPSDANSKRLAAILAEERVQATFFMTGRSVAARPGRARSLARGDHRIYHHTYDHAALTSLSDAGIRRQIRRSQRAFARARVAGGRLLRPPYGKVNKRVRATVRAMGFRTVLWTVDTHDWDASRTPRQIIRSVMRRLESGAVILLHDKEDSQATMAALPRLIRRIRRRGYCFGVLDRRGRVVLPDGA
ncbi:MAG: polysaccharide deacetylase family protein [Actinobacteria bacterium]|nr:polysaccharide deacetylase family protein [Actinomycetota bacterium]